MSVVRRENQLIGLKNLDVFIEMWSNQTQGTLETGGIVTPSNWMEFIEMIKTGKPLRLKMGFDPSRPDIHLGHVVGLRKLRQLQDLGHQVILIVGDSKLFNL